MLAEISVFRVLAGRTTYIRWKKMLDFQFSFLSPFHLNNKNISQVGRAKIPIFLLMHWTVGYYYKLHIELFMTKVLLVCLLDYVRTYGNVRLFMYINIIVKRKQSTLYKMHRKYNTENNEINFQNSKTAQGL